MQKNKSALAKAAELLARQEQSSKVLRQKLLNRNYEEAEIDAALDKLQQKKFLNDEETCANQFERLYAEERLSVRQIQAKLLQRGFDSKFISQLIPEDFYEHDLKAAVKALEKNFSGKIPVAQDFKTQARFQQKIRQHLAAKGFDYEITDAAISVFLESNRD